MTTTPSLARARVQIASIRITRDDYGRKGGHLRLRQPAKNTVVSATTAKPEQVEAIMARSRETLWAALIDRTDRTAMRVLEMRPLP